MNCFDFRHSKLGMTLVEMVISVVILGILVTSTMGLIISSNSIFLSTSAAAVDKQIGNYVFNTLESALRYSTSVGIVNHGSTSLSGYEQQFTIAEDEYYDADTESGRLSYKSKTFFEKIDGKEVAKHFYDESFYGKRTVQYKIKSAGNDNKHVQITITVFRNGEARYTRKAIIKCVNLAIMSNGQNGNPLDDRSSNGTVNQDVYFTCDESLIDASSQTWVLENQIKEFREGYNEILDEYTNALSNAQSTLTEYVNDYKDDNGNWNQSIEKSLITTAIQNRNKAFFGDATINASTKNYFNPATDTITDNGNGTITVPNCNNTDNNLRKYYQAKMCNYLGFSPMETEGYSTGYFNFGDSNSWQIIQGMGKNNDYAYVPELLDGNIPNPYYGVCATREQLYFAFLCQYNSEDTTVGGSLTATKQNVLKSDYAIPDKNPKSLFEGTMFDNEGDHSYAEDMVVLSYFIEDPSKGYLASFYSTNDGKVAPATTHTEDIPYYEQGDYYSSDWITNFKFDVNDVNTSADIVVSSAGNADSTSKYSVKNMLVPDATFFSITNSGWKVNRDGALMAKDKYTIYYTLYKMTVDESKKNIDFEYSNNQSEEVRYSSYSTNFSTVLTFFGDDAKSKIESCKTVSTDMISKLNAKSITDYATLTATNSKNASNNEFKTGAINQRVFKANSNINEGWYYYYDQASSNASSDRDFKEDAYYFFYLKSTDADKAVVAKDTEIQLFTKGYYLYFVRYQQAKFAGSDSSVTYDVVQNRSIDDVLYYDLHGHNYSEEILYGVEWSTWFGQETGKGLLNNLVRSATDDVSDLIFNVIGVKGSFTEGITFPTNGLTKTNAYRVLGNNVTLQVNNTNIGRSYQAAWIVYNNNRSKWYYLPAKSNRITSWVTGKDWASYTDTPTIMNLEGWGSQSRMISDIESRQLSGKAVFGLVNTTSDAIWIALPSKTETLTMSTVTGSLDSLSITGANMAEGFSASKLGYTATASIAGTASDTTVPVYVSATSSHEDYAIEVSYNNNVIERSTSGSVSNVRVDIPYPGESEAVDTDVERYEGIFPFGSNKYQYTSRKYRDLTNSQIVITVTTGEYVTQRYTITVTTSRGDYKYNKNTGAIVN